MRGELQKVVIERWSSKELEKAIKELEKRGYELLKKDDEMNMVKSFDYRHNDRFSAKYNGLQIDQKFRAVMQRMYYRKAN